MSWVLRGLPPPPIAARRLLPGEPGTPEQAALHLLDSHAAAIFALTARSAADFRLLPVLPAARAQELAAALITTGAVTPSLLESLAPLLTPRLLRLRHRLRRRLGRLRIEVPLAAVREMDPICLRHNSRRPGRTLIEKAGAKQTLRAVVRVERFDTMENRVVVAACRRITRQVAERLAPLSPEERRVQPRARSLRRLTNAATALLALPELSAGTLPRPGERPSYALLKDTDYRSVYRALRLLRAEEERFIEEWQALPQVWTELLLLSVWAVMDEALPDAAVPSWVRPLDRRAAAGRLQGSPSRRWLRLEKDCVEEWQVEPSSDGVLIIYRLWSESDIEEERLPITWPLGTVPADRRISQRIEQQLAMVGVQRGQPPVAVGAQRRIAAGDLALSAMNPLSLQQRDAVPAILDTTAVATLTTEAGEQDLPVFGRSAVFLKSGVLGPHALHREQAELLGRLLQNCISADQDLQRLAVVVPDSMSELARRALRQTLGPCWAVWQTVAIGLAYAAEAPAAALDGADLEERRILVIGVSAASCDLAVLGVTGQDAQSRLLIRRPQLSVSLPGIESLLLDSVPTSEREALRSAWLRAPHDTQVWIEQSTEPSSFRRQPVHDVSPALSQRLAPALVKLMKRAGPIDFLVMAGLPAAVATDVERSLPDIPHVTFGESAAVAGARQFLLRHGAGLPTWEDELLPLYARVLEQEQRRRRRDAELIPAGRRIRPGERLTILAKDEFTIRPDVPTFDVPLVQGDSGTTSFLLHYAGRPLPLRKPAAVQILIDYRYGFDGLRGELRALGAAPFARIPFDLKSPDDTEAEVASPPVQIPKYVSPLPPTDSQVQEIRSSLAAARAFLRGLPPQQRRDAKKNASLLAAELRPLVRRIDNALRALTASGADSMPTSIRTQLTDEVGPFLEWLAGIARSRDKDGEAPALAAKEEERVFLARARIRIRRTLNGDRFEATLRRQMADPRLRSQALRAAGNVIDGTPDSLWDALATCDTRDNAEHFHGQVWGLRRALIAHPDLAPSLSSEQAEQTLRVLVDGLCRLPADNTDLKSHFAIALQAIPHLCRVRHAGHLMPSATSVQAAIHSLAELRTRMAEEVLRHAEGGREQDEPLSQAIEALEGREVHLIFVEKDAT